MTEDGGCFKVNEADVLMSVSSAIVQMFQRVRTPFADTYVLRNTKILQILKLLSLCLNPLMFAKKSHYVRYLELARRSVV